MGWFGTWVGEWRETYEAYPVATVLTWVEMLTAVGLFAGSALLLASGGGVPGAVGVGFVLVGVGFAVWFTTVRQPVIERLMAR
jgi:hypothetical protein